MHYLTKELRELLIMIKSTIDISGYEGLVDYTLKTDSYNDIDRIWLQCVRRKWINHLKET